MWGVTNEVAPGLAGWGDTTTGVGSCVQIGIPTMVALIIFSQYLRNIKVNIPTAGKMPIFALFPVLFSIAIMWIISSAWLPIDAFSAAGGLVPDTLSGST